MTTRRSPDGQVYTEVPVVPRHDQLNGRDLGNSHPISAITGLQDALDGKVDAVEGKGLSTEDYTTEEKTKLDGIEAGAEANRVATVKVNGATLTPDADRAVDVTVPSAYGTEISVAGDTLTMQRGDGSVSEAAIGDPFVSAATSYNPSTRRTSIVLRKRGGGMEYVSIDAESGAQKNVIEMVRINGQSGTISNKVESISFDCGASLSYDEDTGMLSLLDASGAVLDTAELPVHFVEGVEYISESQTLRIWLGGQDHTDADMSGLVNTYTAGNGLRLSGRAFALSTAIATAISTASDHVATDSVHVSAADRTKWNGVDSAVKTSGDQTVAGAKTFTGTVVVPTPTANGQAATKAYVDAAVAGGGGGGGGGTAYTAGEGLVLEGTEFSVDPDVLTAVGSIPDKADDDEVVKVSGAQSIAGVKTFSSIPVIPTDTPTQNGQVASKAYVDAAVAGGGGGGGGTTYTAGAGLQLVGTEFSLNGASQTAVAAVSGKAADSAVVHNTGAETVAGVKTFTSSPLVPTPTTDYQASTKKYVDDTASGKADDSAVVKLTGAQTVQGVKTFDSSPIVPTPTADYQVATKKYVDDNAGGGSGTWTVLGSNEYTAAKFAELFQSVGSVTYYAVYSVLKDVMVTIIFNQKVAWSAFYPKGGIIPRHLHLTATPGATASGANYANMSSIDLEALFTSTSSSDVVGHNYPLNGIIESTSSLTTVKSRCVSITFDDIILQGSPGVYTQTKYSVFIQYR